MEQRLGKPVRWLAYPYGSCPANVRAVAGRHFDLAVGTSLRFVSSRSCALEPAANRYLLSAGRSSLDGLLGPSGALYIGVRRALRGVRRGYAN